MTFWPQWPQMTPDWNITHNIGRGCIADAHVWVLWSCYVTWISYSIFSENALLNPVTPNDPGYFFNVITFVEGVKLMHMHESRINATHSVGLDAFLVKMTFWPLWPQVTPHEFLMW